MNRRVHVNKKLGSFEFAECVIYSVNYGEILKNNASNDWDATFLKIEKACNHLKNSGAAAIILCANTMHHIADKLEASVGLPIIHIAIETSFEIKNKNIKKVGLLGTKFTMELDFFTSKLTQNGIDYIIPDESDRNYIYQTLSNELVKGIITPEIKQRYLEISQKLIEKGAEGIILGCTEIPLVIKPEYLQVPLFDTLKIHAQAAVNFAVKEFKNKN